MLTQSRTYAMQCHIGQIHRDGKPAIAHALRVAERCGADDPELYAIAVLHDVLEDCPGVDPGFLATAFGIRVANGVVAMTRGPLQPWNSYIEQVKRNPDAVRVKIADIEDNMARADAQFSAKMPMYQTALSELRMIAATMTDI